MMIRKRVMSALLVFLCAVSSSLALAQFSDRKIRISAGVPEENPVSVGVKKMQEILGEKSGGKMKLTGYYSGILGGDNQAVQALRSGTQEMVITSSSPLAGMIKELGIFDLPFLFANEKEAYAVLDVISLLRDMPCPNIISNSALRNGGATLFFTTFTRVWLPS